MVLVNSRYGNDDDDVCIWLERERLGFESIISRSVGWFVMFFFPSSSSANVCVCLNICSCGVM